MGAFEFNALDNTGRKRKGVLEGDTPRQIRQQIRDKGWMPLQVAEVQVQRKQGTHSSPSLFARSLSAKDLSLITRQLATLVGAATPVEEALGAVARQSHKPRVKSMMLGVRAKVLEGYSLAVALADFPSAFPYLYQATVAAGEQSGHLSVVLDRLADYTERRQEISQNVVTALIYPILLFVVSIGIVVLMLTVVVPQLLPVFESSKQVLPLLTRILIGISDFFVDFWLPLLIGCLLLVLAASLVLKRSGPKQYLHVLLLRTPVVGNLIQGLNASRFARTFSIVTASGVPVLEGLQIASQVVGNLPMRAAVEEVSRKVREGASINKSLEATQLFPPMMVHLIAAGEASGRLEEMLERSANSQERDLQGALDAMVSLLGPVVILLMGGVVTFIMGAILMPILKMNQMYQ